MNFKQYRTQVPSEYQELTFIANSGTQYIDTGLKGSDLADCELEIVMRNDTTILTAFNFNGSYLSGATAQLGLVATSGSECRSSMNFGFADAISTTELNISEFHTIYATNGLQKVDNTVVGTLNFGTLNNGSFLLFARTDPSRTSGINICAGMSLKSFTVKRNNQYIRNMIPAKRKSDNTFGLYDTANGVFYTNQGTGDFTGGTVVESTWTDIPYYIHKTATDTLTLPAVIYPNDTSITVDIKGQSSQASTPTPQNPVDVNGCGERTGNLWNNRGFSASPIGLNHTHNISNNYGTTLSTTEGDEVTITQSAYPTGNVGYQNGFFMIDVDFSKYDVGDVVTISFDYIVNEIHALSTQTETTVYAGKNSNMVPATLSSGDWKISGRLTVVITVIADMDPYVEVRLCGNSITVTNIMLNEGSTALPYEPYGYFIEIEVS
jgi:hypothetical protein